MTLTLMQGHSGSAEEKILRSIKLATTVSHFVNDVDFENICVAWTSLLSAEEENKTRNDNLTLLLFPHKPTSASVVSSFSFPFTYLLCKTHDTLQWAYCNCSILKLSSSFLARCHIIVMDNYASCDIRILSLWTFIHLFFLFLCIPHELS